MCKVPHRYLDDFSEDHSCWSHVAVWSLHLFISRTTQLGDNDEKPYIGSFSYMHIVIHSALSLSPSLLVSTCGSAIWLSRTSPACSGEGYVFSESARLALFVKERPRPQCQNVDPVMEPSQNQSYDLAALPQGQIYYHDYMEAADSSFAQRVKNA
jgi:hypothetical protein